MTKGLTPMGVTDSAKRNGAGTFWPLWKHQAELRRPSRMARISRREFCSGECYYSHVLNSHTLSPSDTGLFVSHLTEQSWIKSSHQCPFPSHSWKRVLVEVKLEMVLRCCQSSLLVYKQRGSAGARPNAVAKEKETGLGKKHLWIFNLLTYSHCYKNPGFTSQKSDTKGKA